MTEYFPSSGIPISDENSTSSKICNLLIWINIRNTRKHDNADALSRLPLSVDAEIEEDYDAVFYTSQMEKLPFFSNQQERKLNEILLCLNLGLCTTRINRLL